MCGVAAAPYSPRVTVTASSVPSIEHGPVEIFVVALPTPTLDPGIVEAVADLVQAGTIDVVDLVVVSRDDEGVTVTEYENIDDEVDLPAMELGLSGLLSEDDLLEIAEDLDPGTSAAVIVLEHVWARELASRLADAGGVVVGTDRIPAPAVNELVAILES